MIRMCETKGQAENLEEESRDQNEEEVNNEEPNVLVKFDIGEFVHNHRKIHLLLGPWVRLCNTVLGIIRWKYPYVSLFWLTISCIIATFSPVFFIILPFVYTLTIMILSGIKKKGKRGNKTLQRTIKKKADNNDLNVKATVEKQTQEDIKEFITLLVQLEALTELMTKGLENINSILKWEDFKASMRMCMVILSSIIVLLLIPMSIILVVGIVSLFCLNIGFKPVAMQVLGKVKSTTKSLVSLVGLRELFPSKTHRQISASSFDEDEWYDADRDIEERSEHTSDEDATDHVDEESSMGKKKDDSSSILAQLADYRRKQKKLNSGKCRMCDVPFSAILKKRQYCRHCGDSFCSKCCSHRVKRSVFGATAPAAYEETVLVCKPCFDQLMNHNSIDQPVQPGIIIGKP